MKALILVNGELPCPDVMQSRIQAESFDLFLAADGGAQHARTLDVSLDAIIGDLDSLSDPEQHGAGNIKLISFPSRKNETDLELALLYAKEQGANRIVIVGAMGGRMDMTVSNIVLLAHASITPCRVEVWHGVQTGWIIRPPGEDITGHPGDTVSLIPFGGDASGVTTQGLEYPLNNAQLVFGTVRGVSNVLDKSSAHIKLSHGLLLAVHTAGGV